MRTRSHTALALVDNVALVLASPLSIGLSVRPRAPAAQATGQNKLLRTLGVGPRGWSLAPAAGGALFAAPLLTMLGTTIALALGGVVGARYGLVERADYWARVRAATVEVPLGLRPWHSPPSLGGDGGGDGDVGEGGAGLGAALAALLGDGARANVIALMTHPVIHHLLKVGEHRHGSDRGHDYPFRRSCDQSSF